MCPCGCQESDMHGYIHKVDHLRHFWKGCGKEEMEENPKDPARNERGTIPWNALRNDILESG